MCLGILKGGGGGVQEEGQKTQKTTVLFKEY